MDPVERVVISIRGARNFPIAEVKLPAHLVNTLPALLERHLKHNPAATIDDLVRGIWVSGVKVYAKGIPPAPKPEEPKPPVIEA